MSVYRVVRLLVITLAIAYHHNAALKGIAVSQFQIKPLWNTIGNVSQFCRIDISQTTETIHFHGSAYHTCSLRVRAPPESRTSIAIPGDTVSEAFFFYVEHEEKFVECPNKYVVLGEQDADCNIIFMHNSLQMNLHGNVSLTISEILAEESVHVGCPEVVTYVQGSPQLNQTSMCHNVKGYHRAFICPFQNDDEHGPVKCQFIFSSDCNANLGKREVIFECFKSSLSQSQHVMMTFPTEVSELDLSQNNIVEIDADTFRGLSNLQSLELSGNKVVALPSVSLNVGIFSDLRQLRYLFLNQNRLNVLTVGLFQGLINLYELNLNNNTFVTLPAGVFQELKNLSHLDLSFNNLDTLPVELFHGLTNLHSMFLYNNQLKTLPVELFQGLNNLNKLNLYGNILGRVEAGLFQGLRELTFLDLGLNNLTELPDRLFRGLDRLTVLFIFKNKLLTLPVGLFEGLDNIQTIRMSKNQLTKLNIDLFYNLTALNTLDIRNLKLSELPIRLFHGLVNLDLLYLSSNRLVTLDAGLFHNLTRLRYLKLADNQLSRLPSELFQGLAKLRILNLADNALSELPLESFKGLNSLIELYVSRNRLVSLDVVLFRGLNNLKLLAFHYNELAELNATLFKGLTSLKSLSLSNNNLNTLAKGTFTGLINLDNVFLNNNQLTVVDSEIFADTHKVTFIDMANNDLQEIPDTKYMTNLSFLNIKNNPLIRMNDEALSHIPMATELFVSQHEICECYVPKNANCSAATARSPYLTCDRLLANRVLVAMMWIIGVNALGGNFFVLVWRHTTSQQKSRVQDLLLSSLATADLLMGLYMLIMACADIDYGEMFPMQSESWRSGTTCRIAGALSIISSEASVFFVTLISIDRFINIRFPYTLRKFGKTSIVVIVVLTWSVAIALGVVPSYLAGSNFKFYDNSNVCIGLPLALTELYSSTEVHRTIHKDTYYFPFTTYRTQSRGIVSGMYYSVAVFLGLNLFCYLLIMASYVEIVRAVLKSSKSAGVSKMLKKELLMTAKVAAIVATDFACWFPVIILGILVQTRVLTLPPSVFAWSVTFVLPINSAINPYLYTISAIVSSRCHLHSKTRMTRCSAVSTQDTKLQTVSKSKQPSVSARNGQQDPLRETPKTNV